MVNEYIKAEFRKMRRFVGLDQAKNVIDDRQINDALIANGVMKLADKDELLVLHDGSDIRKKYASQLEAIGTVRDLDGHIINGYNSFNSVADIAFSQPFIGYVLDKNWTGE